MDAWLDGLVSCKTLRVDPAADGILQGAYRVFCNGAVHGTSAREKRRGPPDAHAEELGQWHRELECAFCAGGAERQALNWPGAGQARAVPGRTAAGRFG